MGDSMPNSPMGNAGNSRFRDLSPLRNCKTKSMFGSQALSQRVSSPAYGFGSSNRAGCSKVFITAEHAKHMSGPAYSPGPVYELNSSLGKQPTSRNESPPMYRFGTSARFSSMPRSAINFPGPGAYQTPSSIGVQKESRLRSPEIYGFGSSTREHQKNVFLGEEFCKQQYGVASPGPSAYGPRSSMGIQATSRNKSAAHFVFGSEERFKYDYVERAKAIPGPGQYNSIGAVARQMDSKKVSLPAFSFGSCERDQRGKVYISPEHEKSHYGECSPGPASIEPKSSLGTQVNSKNASSSAWGFGSAQRFIYNENTTPGPGAYEI